MRFHIATRVHFDDPSRRPKRGNLVSTPPSPSAPSAPSAPPPPTATQSSGFAAGSPHCQAVQVGLLPGRVL